MDVAVFAAVRAGIGRAAVRFHAIHGRLFAMTRLLTGLFRGSCFLAVAACVAAVALARLAPRPATFRVMAANRLEAINGYHFATQRHTPRLFDTATGKFAPMELPGDDVVDCAAFSTWEDDEGRTQVVGRWVDRSGPDGLFGGFGLARYTFPSGEALDRVSLDVMPVGRICFMPGRAARVVFSGGDGKLYRFTFEDDGDASTAGEGPARPVVVGWRERTAGPRPVALNDPIWPQETRLGGRLVVSLTLDLQTPRGRSVHSSQLWWLELDASRTEVVAAGRVVQPGAAAPAEGVVDESRPCIAVTPDGGLAMAYLSRRAGEAGWKLRVAPVDVQSETGIPAVREEATVTLADARAHAAPIFSRDGRWVYSLRLREPKPDRFERIALPEAIRAPGSSRTHIALRTGRPTWN
jgi:hypothetical protein